MLDREFQKLYEKYGPMVYRRCLFLLKDEAWAKDAMQDVFVNVLQNWSRHDWGAPSSFLYTIATNVSISALRKQSARAKHVQPDSDDLLYGICCSSDLEQHAFSDRLLRWLFARQPVSSEAIAVMHFVDGLSYEEVAREVGMSVSGIRKRIYRMRSELKQYVEDGDAHE